jgi:CheY-like chemotaxis protein
VGEAKQEIETTPNVVIKGRHVLVVDDYAVSREITRKSLEKMSLRCDDAASVDEAGRKVAEAHKNNDPFDFVVLDYMLGENSGLDFCHSITRPDAHQPLPLVVMLTAYGYFTSAEKMTQQGVEAFLVKPFFPAHLEAILKLLLNGRLTNTKLPFVTRHTIIKMMRDAPGDKAAFASAFAGTRVLVAEDMPVNRMLMIKVLDKFGCSVDTASNGREAVLNAQKFIYDIIFMDCHMPEMDGHDATRKIREHEMPLGKHTPIIALTADAMTGDRERCKASGMDDHIGKPFKQEQIAEMIKKWWQKKAA